MQAVNRYGLKTVLSAVRAFKGNRAEMYPVGTRGTAVPVEPTVIPDEELVRLGF